MSDNYDRADLHTDEIAELTAQRDALLAACADVAFAIETFAGDPRFALHMQMEQLPTLRAALALAREPEERT